MSAALTGTVTCILCGQSHPASVFYGEILRKDDIAVHQFCLLFSTRLYADKEKACEADVENSLEVYDLQYLKEYVEKTKSQKCIFCDSTHATIECHMKACNRRFHFRCAFDSEKCTLKFDDLFYAFCPAHTIRPRNRPNTTDTCIICLNELGETTMCGQISLNCRPYMWMHRSCAMNLAAVRGYAFQCPVCGESAKFQKYICLRGVFIPQHDTLTQTHNVEVQQTQTKYCEAEVCLLTKTQIDPRAEDKLITDDVPSVKCSYCGRVFHSECGTKHGTFKDDDHADKESNFMCSACMELSDHELSVSTESNELNDGFDLGSEASSISAVPPSETGTDKEELDSEERMAKRFKFEHHYEWQPCKGYHNREWRQFKLNLFMNSLRSNRKMSRNEDQ